MQDCTFLMSSQEMPVLLAVEHTWNCKSLNKIVYFSLTFLKSRKSQSRASVVLRGLRELHSFYLVALRRVISISKVILMTQYGCWRASCHTEFHPAPFP